MQAKQPQNIDDYIAGFPADVREILEGVRATVRKAAPEAVETIKYGMPTFMLHGNLVHFAAFRQHIGFYPAPTGDPSFREELAAFKTGRGSVQFPLNRPMPSDLITRIVRLEVERNLAKTAKKQ